MIHVTGNLYTDSELHVLLYVDLLKISEKDQRVIDKLDAFFYLLSKGYSVRDACSVGRKDPREIDLAISAMKFSKLKRMAA